MSWVLVAPSDEGLDNPRMLTESPWPPLPNADAWERLRKDDVALARGVQAICRRHGIDGRVIDRFTTGSVPVYALGTDRVLKLFPPDELAFFRTEVAALRSVCGQLDVPTPEVIAADDYFDWPYILMTRCRGEPLRTASAGIEPSSLRALMVELGHGVRQLHAVTVPAADLPDHWSTFAAEQRRTAVERQRARGLSAFWLEQIPSFLHAISDEELGCERVLLHTEVMREHVLVDQVDGDWRITGLIDFEPSMVGPAIYDFVSIGLFVTETNRDLLSAVLDGYGIESRGPAFVRRCMACLLLHRYSNLSWYLQRLGRAVEFRRLDELGALWFG
ncbi:MAG: aminoglycoside phosphotransferase family protein [Myxococcota bacterium]